MNGPETHIRKTPMLLVLLPMGYALLRWLAQPPLGWGWLSFVALVPLLMFAQHARPQDQEGATGGEQSGNGNGRVVSYRWVWLSGFLYWSVTLQGIRHAHPALYLAWIALAAYLAFYSVLFLVSLRQLQRRSIPLILAAPIAWVGWEWVRNHLLSGISVCMLGHGLANDPMLIQIADLGGTYLVSALVVLVNAGIWAGISGLSREGTSADQDEGRSPKRVAVGAIGVSVIALMLTLIYGYVRLHQPRFEMGTRFALLGLDEQTEYDQDPDRAQRIYTAYQAKSMEVMERSQQPIDVIVWPESTFSGGLAWMEALPDLKVPEDLEFSLQEYRWSIDQYRAAFQRRAEDLQDMLLGALAVKQTQSEVPHLLVGGPVIEYGTKSRMYSGLLQITPDLQITWYGKNHLVMFGEYIPILSTWAALQPWVPEGLGLAAGVGPGVFEVGNTNVMANICIESAVERVAVKHLAESKRRKSLVPDVILTISNDAWFDHSSVVEHHLRCAQLLAVGCRKPILSAGNGGPTAWIDSLGRVIDRVPQGESGHVIAMPLRDGRKSLYVALGGWPAGIAAGMLLMLLCRDFIAWRRKRSSRTV